jgi:hypothetical protein
VTYLSRSSKIDAVDYTPGWAAWLDPNSGPKLWIGDRGLRGEEAGRSDLCLRTDRGEWRPSAGLGSNRAAVDAPTTGQLELKRTAVDFVAQDISQVARPMAERGTLPERWPAGVPCH